MHGLWEVGHKSKGVPATILLFYTGAPSVARVSNSLLLLNTTFRCLRLKGNL